MVTNIKSTAKHIAITGAAAAIMGIGILAFGGTVHGQDGISGTEVVDKQGTVATGGCEAVFEDGVRTGYRYHRTTLGYECNVYGEIVRIEGHPRHAPTTMRALVPSDHSGVSVATSTPAATPAPKVPDVEVCRADGTATGITVTAAAWAILSGSHTNSDVDCATVSTD